MVVDIGKKIDLGEEENKSFIILVYNKMVATLAQAQKVADQTGQKVADVFEQEYEKEHDVTLPHTGSLQDMGTCVSHKKTIITKIIIKKKDPYTVAKETNHSMYAVDRYLKDYRRVEYCYKDDKDIQFTVAATGLSKYLVKQYWDILEFN